MQVFWTVFAGVCVYVLGQILMKFFLEPIQEFYRLTGEIRHSLIFYAHVYRNPSPDRNPGRENDPYMGAHETFRRQSGELFAKTHTIPLFTLWSRLHLLPKLTNIEKAGAELIALSYGCFERTPSASAQNHAHRRAIEDALGLKVGAQAE